MTLASGLRGGTRGLRRQLTDRGRGQSEKEKGTRGNQYSEETELRQRVCVRGIV